MGWGILPDTKCVERTDRGFHEGGPASGDLDWTVGGRRTEEPLQLREAEARREIQRRDWRPPPRCELLYCPNFIWRKRRTLEREIARITSWNCSKSLPAMDDSTQEGVW